jgi:hypothetical protein
MSDWKTTELFVERTNSSHATFAVGVAIAFLGNRKDDGWTKASLDRIALLARLGDRGTVNLAIRDLEALGELEYERGTSRFHPSRYRIRVEVLRQGADRFRSPLTMRKFPTVGEADHAEIPHRDPTAFPPTPLGNSTRDHGEIPASPPGKTARSIDTDSDIRSLDQSSDQRDVASKDAGIDHIRSDVRAMKTVLEDCRRAAHGMEGDESAEPNASHDSSERAGLPPGWMEMDDARRIDILAAGRRRTAE